MSKNVFNLVFLPPAMARHSDFERGLAKVVFAYGVIGVIASSALLLLLMSTTFEQPDIRKEILWTSGFMATAADSADNIARTFVEGEQALLISANATKDAHYTLLDIAKLTEFSILGFEPFRSARPGFEETAKDLRALSDQLVVLATNTGQNSRDMYVLSESLGRASQTMDWAARKWEESSPFKTSRYYLMYLLAYTGIMHLMFAFVGYFHMRAP